MVGKLTGGLTAMAKMRKVTVVRGYGAFVDPHHVVVEETTGPRRTRPARQQTDPLQALRHRRRLAGGAAAVPARTTRASSTPPARSSCAISAAKMLIVGGGIIGLEMGTVYSTLGARLDVVEMLDGLMLGADRDLVRVWQKMNAPRFDKIMLKTKTVGAEAKADGIHVRFEGEGAPPQPERYDLVLQAVGRSPNGKKIGADKAGVAVNERGYIPVDVQMRTNVPHIFAIGDIVGQPMLAHKAVHEGHVAAEVASGDDKSRFDARVIPSVAYTDPEVAWVGLTEDEAKARGRRGQEGPVPVDGVGPRDRQRPRRRLHQAAVRRADAPHRRRRHRRHARRRPDQRGRAGHRDGRRRGGHRQDDPPAPDARRIARHGRRGGARRVHRRAAAAQALERTGHARRGFARHGDERAQRGGRAALFSMRCARWSSSFSGVVITSATATGQRCGRSSPALQLLSEPASVAVIGARRPSR